MEKTALYSAERRGLRLQALSQSRRRCLPLRSFSFEIEVGRDACARYSAKLSGGCFADIRNQGGTVCIIAPLKISSGVLLFVYRRK